MKKIVLLLAAMLFPMMEAVAQNGSEPDYDDILAVDGLNYAISSTTKEAIVISSTYTDEDGNYLCDRYSGDVVVPKTIAVEGVDYTVTALDSYAFRFSAVTSLHLPSTIREIGESAFCFCLDLTKINLPASVEHIGESAFAYLSSLVEFTFEEGNKNFCFENNMLMSADKTRFLFLCGACDENNPVSVVLPSTVKTIDDNAMALCEGLKEITLPEGLERIGKLVFNASGITSLTIPSTVSYIGKGFAQRTANLKELTVAEGSAYFKMVDGVLYDTDMTGLYKAQVGLGALTIPETVTLIYQGAIENTDIQTLIIPDSVKELQYEATGNNLQLTTLVIGSGVEFMGGRAFYGCDKLKSIYLRSKEVLTPSEAPFTGYFADTATLVYETATLYVPEGTKNLYELDSYWGRFWNIVEYSLTDISTVKAQSDRDTERIYDLRGVEMQNEKGIYIKGGKVRVKN